MDDTHVDAQLSELAATDPAEAPDLADGLADALTEVLDSAEEAEPAPPA